MPSHFKIAAGRSFNFACLNKGKITVGPVTINNPPMTKETGHDSPATKCAAVEPAIQAMAAPTVEIRNMDFLKPRISRKSRLKLPSNNITATAREIMV